MDRWTSTPAPQLDSNTDVVIWLRLRELLNKSFKFSYFASEESGLLLESGVFLFGHFRDTLLDPGDTDLRPRTLQHKHVWVKTSILNQLSAESIKIWIDYNHPGHVLSRFINLCCWSWSNAIPKQQTIFYSYCPPYWHILQKINIKLILIKTWKNYDDYCK